MSNSERTWEKERKLNHALHLLDEYAALRKYLQRQLSEMKYDDVDMDTLPLIASRKYVVDRLLAIEHLSYIENQCEVCNVPEFCKRCKSKNSVN